MKIETLILHPYEIPLITGRMRSGILLNITDEKGNEGWGEIAPLPDWSFETLENSLEELSLRKEEIIQVEWTAQNCFEEIEKLQLLPSVTFGLESALLAILSPLPSHRVSISALLTGTASEILEKAKLRHEESYLSAKLKVSNLTFEEAYEVIQTLKDKFRLRIDVNRTWDTEESLAFFAKFPIDTFDYVEEPFRNPRDLSRFYHPLAIDESFPNDLSFEDLEKLPTLKALIYKPTIQGGMTRCLPLCKWTTERGISLVLSSSFESDLGLSHVASLAHRLSLSSPVGIGTYHHLTERVSEHSLHISEAIAHIPAKIVPKATAIRNF